MKTFSVPCYFGPDRQVPYDVHVGEPAPDAHPLEQQLAWLSRERGGSMPLDAADAFAKLHAIALEHGVSTEELCEYAMAEAAKVPADQTSAEDAGQAPGSAPEGSG
ncbi:DUF2610 domain-containing protein [Streptomyces sp. NPDC001822]|uniref:DUF2610 domain-containing protein n=1 Tax=Streptomyces sp. NPDC001822 TaxID=3364614 RepID=UPI003696B13C